MQKEPQVHTYAAIVSSRLRCTRQSSLVQLCGSLDMVRISLQSSGFIAIRAMQAEMKWEYRKSFALDSRCCIANAQLQGRSLGQSLLGDETVSHTQRIGDWLVSYLVEECAAAMEQCLRGL